MHLVGAGELLGDLIAGVTAAHDQHRPRRDLLGVAVARAVKLQDLWTEALGDRGNHRHLERPGRDHHLLGGDCAVLQLDEVAAVVLADRANAAVELDKQLELLRVVAQVRDDLVAPGITIGIARERAAGQRVVAPRREQPQRVPALTPRRRMGRRRFEDREVAALSLEEVADGQAALTAADDNHLATPITPAASW